MIASDYIAFVNPVKYNADVSACIDTMLSNGCFSLPVNKDGRIFGTVDLEECIFTEYKTITSLVDAGITTVNANSHLFDVLKVLHETDADICGVLSAELEWIGILTKSNIIKALSTSLSISQQGATLIIEMAAHQYSSSEIARIIEGEGAQILGLWLLNYPESGRIRASIKLNTQNAERIIGSLRRFNYEVIATFGDDDYKENVERRFQSLMKYLDL